MKEFVEKLIEGLEEEKSDWNYDYNVPINKAIQIVKDLAEEYKECALCYFGSPCEYQNKDAILPPELLAGNNGWISVKDALPENMQKCLTTAEIYFIPDHVDEPDSYIGVELNVYSKKYGWLHNTEVIAWQPLPAPYKKGE